MNLQYLRSFYVTVKCNSISKAAKELHLTQPGLSMQLKNLEKELDANLLIRSNKGVELTEEGKVVFDYANTILSIQGNIERDLKNLQKECPQLKLGACKSVGEYALPCSIYIFKQVNKDVDIQLELINSSEVIQKLLDRSINIGIIQRNPNKPEIVVKPIASDELLLVCNNEKAKEKITLKELKEIPIILREEKSGTYYQVEKALEEKEVKAKDLNVIYSLNSLEAIKATVLSGKGYSFLPKIIIAQEIRDENIKVVEIEDVKIKFDYYIATRVDYVMTECEKMFVDFIISNKRGFC